MNKKEFVEKLSKQAGISKKDADSALNTMLDMIVTTTKKKDKVTFTGFGTFEATKRKATERRNPRTGETIKVPATMAPKFRAGKAFKDAIK